MDDFEIERGGNRDPSQIRPHETSGLRGSAPGEKQDDRANGQPQSQNVDEGQIRPAQAKEQRVPSDIEEAVYSYHHQECFAVALTRRRAPSGSQGERCLDPDHAPHGAEDPGGRLPTRPHEGSRPSARLRQKSADQADARHEQRRDRDRRQRSDWRCVLHHGGTSPTR